MNVDFIDFVEIEGEVWYKANDILLALGYTPQGDTGIVQCIRNNPTNRQNSKLFKITPRKFIEGSLWWNETSLMRVKTHLNNTPLLKSKVSMWDMMETIRKDSLKSVLKLEKKVEAVKKEIATSTPSSKVKPKKVAKKEEVAEVVVKVDFVQAYKSSKDFKAFLKIVRENGFKLNTKVNSWKRLSEVYPEIYKEIEPHFSERTKRYMAQVEEKKPSPSTTEALAEVKQDVKKIEKVVFDPLPTYKVVSVKKSGLFGLCKDTQTMMFNDVDKLISFLSENIKDVVSLEID